MTGYRFDAVLIDLAGVLYTRERPVPGAVAALSRLRTAGLPLCFVTNTTRRTRTTLVQTLADMGFDVAADEILTAARAAHAHVTESGLRPHLLIHPALADEFADLDTGEPDSVLVGDAGDGFTYAALNTAFRVLMAAESPRLVAMGANRYFADDGGLSLDMGAFVRALEFAAGVEATVVGKPATAFFRAGLSRVACPAERTVMIGDDVAGDIGGARATGLPGILVRTGKYRAGDEHGDVRPDHVSDDFAAAVDWILNAG